MAPSSAVTLQREMDEHIRLFRAPVSFRPPASSPMIDFYRDKVVFLTGGTGFLGQLLVEKLLRSGVRRIYVLARSKRNRSAAERLTDTYVGAPFERLRTECDAQYMQRITAVDGEMGELRLGISDDQWNEITAHIQIVLHVAADVRFDVPLTELLRVNVRGTREVLRLAEACGDRLQVCLYVSTAYSHCPRSRIDEHFYEAPIDPDTMIGLLERLSDDRTSGDECRHIDIITQRIIRPWPNTYSYTKALAEELVRRAGSRLPVTVVRPSIVIATNADPIPGWINNIYGLTGILVAVGLGFQRIMPFDQHKIGDFVCADHVVSSTLVAAWTTATQAEAGRRSVAELCPPRVYHVVGYEDRPTTFREVQFMIHRENKRRPTPRSMWYPCSTYCGWPLLEPVYVAFYHVVPALLADAVLRLLGERMRLMPIYRKTHKFIVANRYFMRREWAFGNGRMKSAYERMSGDDRAYFGADVRAYNFREFARVYILGMRMYVLGEKWLNLRYARMRMHALHCAHLLVMAVYYVGMLVLVALLAVRFFGQDWLAGWTQLLLAAIRK